MLESNRTKKWEIVLRVTGVAKRQRIPKHHRFVIDEIEQSHDQAPDLETYKSQSLSRIKQEMRTTQKASLNALPFETETYEGGVIMKSMRLFDPRAIEQALEVTV